MSKHSYFDAKAKIERDGEAPPPVPRWVKAFGIAAIVLGVILIVMMASGHGGPHSPLRHFRSHATAADTAPASGAQRP
jgi:hypothetical protein